MLRRGDPSKCRTYEEPILDELTTARVKETTAFGETTSRPVGDFTNEIQTRTTTTQVPHANGIMFFYFPNQ